MISGTVFSQNVDEIIEKHIKAHGGMKNWEKVQNMKITGYSTTFSERKPFNEIKAKGNKYYSSFYLGLQNVIEGCDGNFYWTDNPWFELPFARQLSPVEENVVRQKSEFCTPFFNYKEKGYQVKYDGKEDKEGVEVFKLTLTRDNGQTETWFLNSGTYLEFMSVTEWADFTTPVQQEAFFDDFRKVGDIIIPFYYERVFDSRINSTEIESVELNVEIEPGKFNLPVSEPIKKLGFMAGKWDVVFEAMGRSGSMDFFDSTTSVINYVENKNIISESISYIRFLPVEKNITWTYSNEQKNYLMTAFNDVYSSTDVFQGSFQGDSLVFDNSLISFTKESDKKTFTKYIYSQIKPEGFILEMASTRDGGVNWRVTQKFTYSRKTD